MKPRWSEEEQRKLIHLLGGMPWTLTLGKPWDLIFYYSPTMTQRFTIRIRKVSGTSGVAYHLYHFLIDFTVEFKSLEHFAHAIRLIRLSELRARENLAQSLHSLRETDAKSAIVAAEVSNDRI